MRKAFLILALSLLVAAGSVAQDTEKRAWQQRLGIRIPVSVPAAEVDPVNPFSTELDDVPRLLQSTAPRKVDVRGTAIVAAYVDARGDCQGAVPIEMPYSGIATALVQEFGQTKFEPARRGQNPEPTWAVVRVPLESRVKEAVVRNHVFELPDPAVPAVPTGPTQMEPPGRLRDLPSTEDSILTAKASPRRFRFRSPSRTSDVVVVALVHVTSEGKCDRYVPLEMDSGLRSWFEGFVGSWRFEAGRREGEAVDCWLTYTANLQVEMSSIRGDSARVLRDRTYTPNEDAS